MKGTATSIDNNKYSFSFPHPFEDGTEKWYIIRAGDKISEVYFLQVGHVERSNIKNKSFQINLSSTLAILKYSSPSVSL